MTVSDSRKVKETFSLAVTFGAEVSSNLRLAMNTTPLTNIAPDIFRKRLLVEGYFAAKMSEETLKVYFSHITRELGLRTYGEPVIHRTSGEGKNVNEGFDGFVPLVDSGIYIGVWLNPKFLSTIIYTCGEFDAEKAVSSVRNFFQLSEFQAAIF
ncbi:MAG: S-adenosylmethionine decarboxylase [Pyrinomonadaceae bacterium]